MNYSLELFNLLKKCDKNVDFSQYEKNINASLVNELKKSLVYDKEKVNLDFDGAKIEKQVQILKEVSKLQDTCKKIITQKKHFTSLPYSIYDSNHRLILNDMDKIKEINNFLKTVLDKDACSNVYVNLPSYVDGKVDYLAILYYNMTLRFTNYSIEVLSENDIGNILSSSYDFKKYSTLVLSQLTDYYYLDFDLLKNDLKTKAYEKDKKNNSGKSVWRFLVITFITVLIVGLLCLVASFDLHIDIYKQLVFGFGFIFLIGLFNYYQLAHDNEIADCRVYPWVCLVFLAIVPILFRFINSNIGYSFVLVSIFSALNILLFILTCKTNGINFNWQFHFILCLLILICSFFALIYFSIVVYIIYNVINFVIQTVVAIMVEKEY